MTDFPQALGWLNQFDAPHFSFASILYRGTALDPDAPGADRVEAFNRLLEIAEVSDDPLEYPEVRVLRADYHFLQGNYAIAHLELSSAFEGYQAGSVSHQLAVVEWLLGLVEWELGMNIEAVNNWRAARDEFIQLEKSFREIRDQDRAGWYAGKAREMGGILACTPEEAYMWNRGLNVYEGTTPVGVQEVLRMRLETATRDGDAILANQTIERLMQYSLSQNQGLEKGEVFLECGFWKYQSGDTADAYSYLKKAIQIYHPDTLRQALARWILGAMQWKDAALAEKAMQNWTVCRQAFDMLRQQANWEKNLELLKWYREKSEQMDLAFARMVGS
ncbi:MAG TPA: hypothetical protein VLM83_01675 [Anaerolineales bacterium]|nr:hypothetical protein [Anaerolineales bacterium]